MINGPNGVYGNVSFSQNGCGESVLIEISVIGLSPGEHGFHVHEKGDLSNGCMSTGAHYNPEKVKTIRQINNPSHLLSVYNLWLFRRPETKSNVISIAALFHC